MHELLFQRQNDLITSETFVRHFDRLDEAEQLQIVSECGPYMADQLRAHMGGARREPDSYEQGCEDEGVSMRDSY